ncbi:hypothetical protein LIER_15496 [Lithospermum erythrorhizon]|uniref:Uncharacterized protein n=1 Tax=Lithospermum erythrorhizon TaxID=34254 RepID=A0AAV3Q535_LITER
MENLETEEDAEVFATNVLMEPTAEADKSSKVSASKRRKANGEGPRRKGKKSKVPTIVEGTEGVEGHDEAPIAEPGLRDSQILEGFHNRTSVSVVAKIHLHHLCDYYSVHQKVLMRIPLPGETPDMPQEEGCTPVFWEFFNYGLRLTASPFVDSLISSIARAPSQLGLFA